MLWLFKQSLLYGVISITVEFHLLWIQDIPESKNSSTVTLKDGRAGNIALFC